MLSGTDTTFFRIFPIFPLIPFATKFDLSPLMYLANLPLHYVPFPSLPTKQI